MKEKKRLNKGLMSQNLPWVYGWLAHSNVQISNDLFGDDPHVRALALVPFVDILVRILLEIRCLWFTLVLALFIS
jgi:hypothetical protein